MTKSFIQDEKHYYNCRFVSINICDKFGFI